MGHGAKQKKGFVGNEKEGLLPNQTPSFPLRPRKGKDLSQGFWNDVITMRWMRRPSTSAKMMAFVMLLCLNWELVPYTRQYENPFAKFLWISNRLEDGRYGKSYWDLAFVAYYVVFWSFIRQSITIYFLNPLARRLGIKKEGKVERFGEQGYAVIYNAVVGSINLYIMYNHLPTWYYRTEYFWIGYPHWQLPALLKFYYLFEFAYWCQQAIIIILKIEKPRKDYNVLCIHHVVTLWLIGWSYLFNLTYIGVAVFMTMDWSDAFFSLAKCFNYLNMEKTKTVAFGWFVIVWTYLRHYLNLRILWSVLTEFDLIPDVAKVWKPEEGAWMAPWMKWQIFTPLFLLQLLCIYWYYFIWKILLRALFTKDLDDERSDDEDDEDEAKKCN